MLFSNYRISGGKGASVPSQKNRHAPARCAIALALSLAFTTPMLHAAGLGRLSVQSALGQPLRAEVEVTSVAREEAPTLAVKLASQSAFRQAGLDFNPALSQLRFTLEKRGETNYVVRVSSLNPINEPYLDVLLELTWGTGRVFREYTVLLDPPALRASPELIPPVAAQTPPPAAATAPAQAAAPAASAAAPERPAPAPTPTLTPTPREAPAPAPVAATSGGDTYTVKSGDTLGRIAAANKGPGVSLDQMLVAMFRANPNAFVGDNMNRLIAGRNLTIPGSADAEAITASDARREVLAQSQDFAQYRSRLAQAATGGTATVAAAAPATAAGRGQITAKVEDRSAPTKGGDQLKIAKAEPTPASGAGATSGQAAAQAAAAAAAAATKAKDEEVARQRAMKEAEERAAELKKTNDALKKALELQSKAGAQAQQQAQAKAAPAPAPAPAVAPPPPPPAPAPAPVAAAPTPAPAPAEPPKAEVQPAPVPAPVAAAPVPAPVAKAEPAKKAAPPPAPPAPEASFVDQLMSPYVLGGAGALLILLLVGFNVYRKRKVEKTDEFKATGEGLRANSLFGSTGGQSVDTGATSTFNSSFIPAASQLDSNEVDPVAEADVYIAYGREEQAEDILKEALRLQPDRHAVRVKLLEIYSRRGDKASFNAVVDELRNRTGGAGEDWERAVKLGRALDPSNPLYAGAMEASMRGPTTELRLNPNTAGGKPATLSGLVAPAVAAATAAAAAGAVSERKEPTLDFGLGGMSTTNPVDTRMPSANTRMTAADTHMTPDTAMQVDSRMTADTTQAFNSNMGATTQAPTTRFEATLSDTTTPSLASTFDTGAAAAPAIDFSSLDFDLGAKTSPAGAQPVGFDLGLDAAPAPARAPAPPAVPAYENAGRPSIPATMTGAGMIPDVDLNIPVRTPAPAPSSFSSFSAPAPASVVQLEESLSRPTLLGDVGSLPDENSPRLTSNTDQATVPLIDFDLSGSDVELGGRRTETQAGSPLAAQMATKLDLARGYIDLGVKDGARELLEEVMRDGTRDQRQSAVELMKQVEA
jgi:pilus assembly protein FimV